MDKGQKGHSEFIIAGSDSAKDLKLSEYTARRAIQDLKKRDSWKKSPAFAIMVDVVQICIGFEQLLVLRQSVREMFFRGTRDSFTLRPRVSP